MDAVAHTPGRETCPVCGAEFGCSAAQAGCACWCEAVAVTPEALRDLAAAVHSGCVCPACLQGHASGTPA